MELHLNEDSGSVHGKENLVSSAGKVLFNGTEILCPVSTSSAIAIGEQSELRAYKLGKQKCSYNQVELIIKDICSKESELQVAEAIETAIGNEVDDLLKESCLKFNVRFVNSKRVHLYIYVVYASPYCSITGGNESKHARRYYWVPVTRSKCRKGCKGPVIRGLQRFGRMSRRVSNQAFADHGGLRGQEHVNTLQSSNITVGDSWKEPRHLYIAIDEASTHVCPRPQTSKFRLLVAAYDDQHRLLGSTVSSCIRVLANNDAPLGAASFKLHCHIKGIERSANCSPITSWPRSGMINDKRQSGRVPLQDMTQTKFNPSMEAPLSTDIIHVLCYKDQDLHFPGNEQKCMADSPSSSCCSDEALINEDDSSLEELCQRVFDACSCKQQGVITLRKFATILGASRNSLLEIFSVLATIQVVQEQGKEKYLWLGSDCVAGALQEILDNQENESSSHTTTDCETGFDIRCECPSISKLGRRFCLLFLSNKYAAVKWEFVVDNILGTTSDIKIMKSTLWKISVILSALHLIVTKKGPVFEWSGSEGVAAHLKSPACPWLTRRCQDPRYYKSNKRQRLDSEVENHGFAADKDEYVSSCKEAQIFRSLHDREDADKGSRLSPPPNACLSIEREPSRFLHKSSAVNCELGSSINIEHRHTLEELQVRGVSIPCSSTTARSCQNCNRCSQGNLRMLCCNQQHERNHKNRNIATVDKGSACHAEDEAPLQDQPCYIPSLDENGSCLTWQWSRAADYIGYEDMPSDYGFPVLSFPTMLQDDPRLITNKCPAHHPSDNAAWHFNPLAYLHSLYTPQQIVTLQQCNPGFLINFIRNYRQLYHKYSRKTNALVQWPSAIRPSYSSFCLFRSLAAK